MRYSENQTSFDLEFYKFSVKLSLSSKNHLSEKSELLLKEKCLGSKKELFEYLFKKVLKKADIKTPKHLLERCKSFDDLKSELKNEIRKVCNGNISKAIEKELEEECEKYEI